MSFSAYIVRSALAYPDERLGLRPSGRLVVGEDRVPGRVGPRPSPAAALRRLGLAELRGCLVGLTRYPSAQRAAARSPRLPAGDCA